MKMACAAGLLALAGLLTTGVAVAGADEIEVDHLYAHWDCRQGSDGFWHVWLLN